MNANKAGKAFAAALYMTGCGYVGEPLYPALNIPKATSDLRAVERGTNIDVNFTIPPLTTEGLLVKQIGGVELRIGPNVIAPFQLAQWVNSATRIAVPVSGKTGPVHVKVPVQPFVGQDVIVGVRSVGGKGRASEWSNLVTLTVRPPVATPVNFTPVLEEKGVLLKWEAPGVGSFRIFRRAPSEPHPSQLGTAAATQYLDATAEFGAHYEYWVEGVQGEAESELTGPLAVTPEDKFAPAVPVGLVASAGLGTIELAWERNTEPDFKGYRVYRRMSDGSLEKLGELIEAPSFSDNKIEAGKRYGYSISSVDLSGNESEKSPAVEIVAP